MKKLVFLLVLIFAVSCEQNVLPPPHNSSLTTELSSAENKNLNSIRHDIARALALSIGQNPKLRSLIKSFALEKMDGDYTVLLKDILSLELGGSGTVERLISSNAHSINDLHELVMENPRMQLLLPLHAEKWNADDYSPLVATYDFAKDETEITTIAAYDRNGNSVTLDANREPKKPVIVFGLNERSDEQGTIYGQYKVGSKELSSSLSKVNQVNTPLKYLIITGVYLRDDHEPWYLGDPEIYSATRIIVNTPQRKGMFSVNTEWEWNNGTWYVWEDGVNNDTYVDNENVSIDLAIYEEDFPAGPDDLVGNGFVQYTLHTSLTWNNLSTSEQRYDSDTSHNSGCIVKIKKAN